jgi:hypothetical protein
MYSIVTILVLSASSASATALESLDAASKSGKASFVLLYDQTAPELEKARLLVREAAGRVPGSVVIEVNRGDAADSAFVAKYRILSAPVPLILVASTTGVITGAIPAGQATVDRLVKMIPSARKTEIMKALAGGNAVFITASRKNMATTEAVNSQCAAACQQMMGKSVQIQIDMDDPAEKTFLTELKVDLSSIEPVTLVANPQGQIAGVYKGTVQMADLVTAATKKVGGCCPSTVAKPDASCDPKKN